MSDLTVRSRAEAQRDIAVAALKTLLCAVMANCDLTLHPRVSKTAGLAHDALVRIEEIEKTAPSATGHWVWIPDAPEEPK